MLSTHFDEQEVLHDLKHYLPAQAPLKDFVHHNTLHAFQGETFYDGIRKASRIFGYKVFLSLEEYRRYYHSGKIKDQVLDSVIASRKGGHQVSEWKQKVLTGHFHHPPAPRIGLLRAYWKSHYQTDLDSLVHPILFRTLCSYLDQGVSIWSFPVKGKGFLAALKALESNSKASLFRTQRAKQLLLQDHCNIHSLLQLLVADETVFRQYLFDQQFMHPGWSGMVAAIETSPETLLDQRTISLHDLIVFELLLEIDALEYHSGGNWQPISEVHHTPVSLFAKIPVSELDDCYMIWQDAFEWSYYDEVLSGLSQNRQRVQQTSTKNFQALFCIDDRECSIRRYVEQYAPDAETFGTPGFFGVPFYYQPEDGKFIDKLAPGPLTPKHLIKETGAMHKDKLKKDVHISKHSHSFHGGWLLSQTIGFAAAFRLIGNLFRPSSGSGASSSLKHTHKSASLSIEYKGNHEHGLQIGFTVEEMANAVEGVLRSIGLVQDFAPLVYALGHGASTINNPHYSAYDCGACSGRAGSVNSRVFCFMANHPEVRKILATRNILIPTETYFMAGLHDTTRDDIVFYEDEYLSAGNKTRHTENEISFREATDANAKERSRKFAAVNTKRSAAQVHQKIRLRSFSIFEPRPELNHATNALTIVAPRSLTKGLFLDRRSFLNSYNYRIDPEGNYLTNILKAATPVTGGVNLEYYFSRVDNQKLGAGTKLPHNVMGLLGVANGIDGDLRPGLPEQMIEMHDPVRMLFIIEQYPEVVQSAIQRVAATYEWFKHEWVHLIVIHPHTGVYYRFSEEAFTVYEPTEQTIGELADITPLIESGDGSLPVCLIAC